MNHDPFLSAETDRPFDRCIACALPLVETGEPWTVAKEFVRGECVFEYAICQPCRDRLAAEMSEESRANVARFLASEIDWTARLERLRDLPGDSPLDPWLDHCAACGAGAAAVDSHGIAALFLPGGLIARGPLPIMLCGACSERVQGVLSKKTRDVWDRFVAEHFPGPPADLANLPTTHLPVIF